MEITFLGTAAADGIPAAHCICEVCDEARRRRGKDLRTRTSVLIDRCYKIDFPPDSHAHSLQDPAAVLGVRHLFITHMHGDHLYVPHLLHLRHPFSHRGDWPRVQVYAGRDSIEEIRAHAGFDTAPIDLHEVKPFDHFTAGDAQVTAFPARHAPNLLCLLYLFEIGGRSYLHAHDTGDLLPEVATALQGKALDAIAFDCTHGLEKASSGHGSLSRFGEVVERLRANGAVSSKTRLIATHFSHNGRSLHRELSVEAEKRGMTVAFDGMRVNLD